MLFALKMNDATYDTLRITRTWPPAENQHMKRHLVFGFALIVTMVFGGIAAEDAQAQAGGRPRPGGNQQGQKQGQKQNEEDEVKLPEDPKLLELHKNFVLAAEKLAGDYERTNQTDKARSCYTEILRLVPSYTPAADKLAKIKVKEATAEKKLVDVYANKGWQDTGITVEKGRPLTIRANGEWVMKMTYTLPADGIEIPKELRDFPLGALVGAISESADLSEAKPFMVGNEKSMEPSTPGKLYLRMYDSNPDDNTGRLGVIVEGTFKK
ncbi:MAG: hypothetical protein C0483_10830 [Pirellula sp.]|nr:hypothetical protein [Pirellula sp.]